MNTAAQPQTNLGRVLAIDVQANATARKPQRIPALDFTKGTLVLIMVLYHWVNYFIGPQWEYYEYLRFLTPSFIFITGFLVSNVYLSRYAAADSRLSKRLFTRGLKLLAIFIALNLARTLIIPVLGTGSLVQNSLDPRNIFTVFVSGNLPVTGGKLVSFSILVPISYLLMFSGALMLPYRFYKYTFHVVCVLLLLAVSILRLTDVQSYNLEFVTIGMLGVVTGFLSIETINHFVRRPYTLAFAYPCYTVAITLWGVPFPLLVVGVFLSLMVIYLVGDRAGESGIISTEIILLGKYSLLGYLSQIAILQILAAIFHRLDLGLAGLLLSFLAAFALTIATAEMVDRGRAKRATIDRLYKAVFA